MTPNSRLGTLDVARRRMRLSSGIEIEMFDWGGGGPLALLHHANGFCAGLWGEVAELLRARFRVVAYDARGHGASSKPDPETPENYQWPRFGEDAGEVAQRLAAEHGGRIPIGIGHSFGGTALMMAAADAPQRFERLLLIDPVLPSPSFFAQVRARAAENRDLSSGARKRRQVFASRAETRSTWAGRAVFADWTPRALDLYAEFGLIDRPDGQVELACPAAIEATIFEQAIHLDAWKLAERVATPALILCAEKGNFGRAMYDEVSARMGAARVADVPTGHLVPMERPDLVAQHALQLFGA
jgi:pimeloyl-ACP methyl ester carboxylesterase